MKKKFFFIFLALIAVTALAVSCNSEIQGNDANGDKLVYASFGNSKDLQTSYNFIDYNNLYWFYQAEKKDHLGTTGTMSGNNYAKVPGDSGRKGLDGVVGPFSQGEWKFTLFGYQTESTTEPTSDYISVVINETTYYYTDLVYGGASAEKVPLKYGAANAIPVTVEPRGNTGSIYLDDVKFNWASNTLTTATSDLILKIEITSQGTSVNSWENEKALVSSDGYTLAGYVLNSNETSDIPKGTYSLKFSVIGKDSNENEYTLAEQTLYATVFGSQTTTISGGLVEGLFVENAHFVATDVVAIINVTTEGANSFTTTKTPSGASGDDIKTTVSVPAGTLTTGSQSNLTIDIVSVDIAQDVAASMEFVATSGVPVAALSINLTEITTTTDSSGNISVREEAITTFAEPVTVSTYIEKNLSNVSVYYNGDLAQPTNVTYDPNTGLLTFKTTHFSSFFVTSDIEAMNVTTGVSYSKLSEAIDKAQNGQTIKLMSDVVFTDGFKIAKTLSLDLNNHSIGATSNFDPTDYVADGYYAEEISGESKWVIKSLFDGGNGTEKDPFIIGDYKAFQNVSKLYDAGYYYYKVKDGVTSITCENWTPVNLNGSIDGNNVTINSLDQQLFRNVGTAPSDETYVVKNFTVNASIEIDGSGAALIRQAGNNLEMNNITVHGHIEGNNGAASFVFFGPGNISGEGNEKMNWKFVECFSDATIVATGDVAVGFVKHPFCYASQSGGNKAAQDCCLITIEDSVFTGTLNYPNGSKFGYKYFVGNANDMLVKTIYSQAFIGKYGNPEGTLYGTPSKKTDGVFFIGNYPTEGPKISGYSDYGTCTDKYLGNCIPLNATNGNLPDKYSVFTVNKTDNAVRAKAVLEIAPNDTNDKGSYLGTYMSEEIDLTSVTGSFTTSEVKYFDITINQGNEGGLQGNTYNVVNSFYGHTYNTAGVRVMQYDEDGIVLSVTYFKFEKN